MKNKKKIALAVVIALLLLWFIISPYFTLSKNNTNPNSYTIDTIDYNKPQIDSIKVVRDSIVYKVNYIDSITYERIKETNNISDSAAVKLFIKLVSE